MCYLVLVILTLGLKSNALRPEDDYDSLEDRALNKQSKVCNEGCEWLAEQPENEPWLAPVANQPDAGSYCRLHSSRMLGEGGFGTVYEAQRKQGELREQGGFLRLRRMFAPTMTTKEEPEKECVDIAAKYILVSKRNGVTQRSVMQEFRIQQRLKHQSILQVYALARTPSYVIIFMEKATGGELFAQVAKLNESRASMYFKEVSKGLVYMHKHKIAHLDLKPENILLTSDATGSHAKIIDFGLVHDYSTGDKLESIRGTPGYMPPEMARGEECDGYKADVWSLGVTIYAVHFGMLPFPDEPLDKDKGFRQAEIAQGKGESTIAALKELNEKNYGSGSGRYCSQELQSLLDGMLRINPKKRWSMRQVSKSQWMKSAPALLEIGEAASPEIYEVPDGAPKLYRRNAVAL